MGKLFSDHTRSFQELDTAKGGNKTLKDKLRKENRKSRHLTEKKENVQTPYFEVIEVLQYFHAFVF
jgi:hypothetical protein